MVISLFLARLYFNHFLTIGWILQYLVYQYVIIFWWIKSSTFLLLWPLGYAFIIYFCDCQQLFNPSHDQKTSTKKPHYINLLKKPSKQSLNY